MRNGFVIALAWPETLCKRAGAWYDEFMSVFGTCKNGYYKVGHAATILVEINMGICYYFDFGRYHAPGGFGRIRNLETDPDLTIRTIAEFDTEKCQILNIDEILKELQANESCHGSGQIHASYTLINFDTAYKKAIQMQGKDFWKYGPFELQGTNCSRFVRTIILSGGPRWKEWIKIAMPPMLTPTPLWNVAGLNNKVAGKTVNNYYLENLSEKWESTVQYKIKTL